MKSKKIDLFTLKPNKETLKLVNPGERAFTYKPLFVYAWVKMTLSTSFRALPIALIFGDIWAHAAIPKELARFFRVKRTVCMKESVLIVEAQGVQLTNYHFETVDQVITIVVIAGNYLTGGKNKAGRIGYRQDIAGFCLLSALVGDCFAPFFAALWLPARLRIDKFSS